MAEYLLVKCRDPLTVKDLEGLMDDDPGLVVEVYISKADALAAIVNDTGWDWVIIGGQHIVLQFKQ